VCHGQHQHSGTLINECFSQNPNYKDITVSEQIPVALKTTQSLPKNFLRDLQALQQIFPRSRRLHASELATDRDHDAANLVIWCYSVMITDQSLVV
jgi:hypothetical protein